MNFNFENATLCGQILHICMLLQYAEKLCFTVYSVHSAKHSFRPSHIHEILLFEIIIKTLAIHFIAFSCLLDSLFAKMLLFVGSLLTNTHFTNGA